MTSRYGLVGETSGRQANSRDGSGATSSPMSRGGPPHFGGHGRARPRSQERRPSRLQSQCQRLPWRVRSLCGEQKKKKEINHREWCTTILKKVREVVQEGLNIQYSNNTLCHETDVISMTGTLSLYPLSITTGDVKGIAEWFADAS